MKKFIFDLQRFDTQIISAGQSVTIDGVTYKAVSDAQFNLDDAGKVSGLASGKVTAVVNGVENSPTITFDATDSATTFAASGEETLSVTLSGRTFRFKEGTATVKGDKVTTGAVTFSISGTYSNADYEFTVEDSSEFYEENWEDESDWEYWEDESDWIIEYDYEDESDEDWWEDESDLEEEMDALVSQDGIVWEDDEIDIDEIDNRERTLQG